MKNMRRHLWIALVCLALVALGCNKNGGRSDSQIASDIQNKIFSDSNVPDKQITINSNKGVVTLSGAVSSDAARTAAASDAAQVDGVKTVVNNLEVASAGNTPPPVTPPVTTPPVEQPAQTTPQTTQTASNSTPATTTKPPRQRSSARGYGSGNSGGGNNGDNGLRTTVPNDNGANNTANNTPPPPPPPPPPPRKVTIPAGTQFSIRMGDEVDSEKAQVGDVFHGSISAPITVDDETVVPTSADVEGRVVDVKSAGRFAGGSLLTLQLTKLVMNGKSYGIQTDQWSKQGTGKGKGTAAKVGGGAAVGAVLGGIFGGGKGAAIGAAAGAGAGTAGSAVGKGQQIDLKPEAVITFTLQNSLTVTPGSRRQSMQ
ncbi:MAG TPA: BON domain-containing protein [Candidatus Angelobacter sp.]